MVPKLKQLVLSKLESSWLAGFILIENVYNKNLLRTNKFYVKLRQNGQSLEKWASVVKALKKWRMILFDTIKYINQSLS